LVVSPFFCVLSLKSHLTCPFLSVFRYDGTQDTKVTDWMTGSLYTLWWLCLGQWSLRSWLVEWH
jgi:hypothetical protein